MFRKLMAILILFSAAQVNAQDGPSAFIDPFAPNKPVKEKSNETGKSSIFPTFPAPKLPKMPKIPNLNPFAKKKTTNPRNPGPKKPNMFQQIGTGTKNFFTQTTHTLMPWTKPKPQKLNGAIVPAFMQNAQKKEKKQSGIQLMNFFQPAKKEKKINSPSDFFKQERPKFRR